MEALVVFAVDLDTRSFDSLSPGAYIALMGLGFLIGTLGHIVHSKVMIATGFLMILLATVLLPLTAHVSG